jgi:putative transcriptional regulator
MKITRMKIDVGQLDSFPRGRIDLSRLDETTEQDIAGQQRQDDAQAMLDTAKYTRDVRKRLGLTQQEFARRIDVSLETVRNWEQGRRRPTGAAKALLRILNKAPEVCLAALA